MKLKPGVRLAGIRPEIVAALIVINRIMDRLQFEMVVTSCTDGVHSKGSRHYVGLAVDIRSKGLPKPAETAAVIQEALGSEFDVLLEGAGTDNEHLHVEFDPR